MATPTATDFANFVYSTGVGAAGALGNWQAAYRISSGTIAYADTGVPITASQQYRLQISFLTNQTPTGPVITAVWTINGVQVFRMSGMATAITYIPMVGIQAGITAAAEAVTLRELTLAQNRS